MLANRSRVDVCFLYIIVGFCNFKKRDNTFLVHHSATSDSSVTGPLPSQAPSVESQGLGPAGAGAEVGIYIIRLLGD